MKAGVIGFGYWGTHITRNLHASPHFEVAAAADIDPEALDRFRALYPTLATHPAAAALLADDSIRAVAVCTPVDSHHEITLAALQAGKHVLVEKPVTVSVAEARALGAAAETAGRILMIDHTYLYHPAIRKIRDLFHDGSIGKPLHLNSVRTNLGKLKPDINVVWDLAVHDVSILQFLTGSFPVAVQAFGFRHSDFATETSAHIALFYPEGFTAQVHCSWTAPAKVREITVTGERRMLSYDEVRAPQVLRSFDCGWQIGAEQAVSYRRGSVEDLPIPAAEPLAELVHAFYQAIRGAESPSGWQSGVEVIQILDAANRSLAEGGRKIALKNIQQPLA